jgi:hypothetical protein
MITNQLHQPAPLDLSQSKIETTDPVVAAYYRAAFYEVKSRYEDNRYIFTIDVDKIKSSYTAEEIEERQLVLMNFIAFFNSNMNLLSLLEKKLLADTSERSIISEGAGA